MIMRTNMKPTILLLAVIPLLIFLAACSDPQTAPTSPQAQVSVHPEGWAKDTASPNFHGAYLAPKQYNASECQPCHGSQYDGGISGVSCKQCHASYPHSEGWVGAHSNFIKSIHYDVNSCKPCHGQDYSTIKTNNSCLTCHTKPGGPEACNTCHGNFSGDPTDLTQDAPPRGLNGETSPTTPAVGAHQAHLAYFPAAAVASTCQECHTLPLNFSAPSHIDPDSKAEVLLNGALTRLITEGGARVPNRPRIVLATLARPPGGPLSTVLAHGAEIELVAV